MIEEKILFVDDDASLLSSYQRALKQEFHIITAPGGREGIEIIKNGGSFAVIVSDLRMPEMDGIQFLAKVKELAPKSVRMMLTGFADLQMSIEAVNRGNIFRLMTKPCPPEDLISILNDGIGQFRLVNAEKELLERTLSGSIKVLADILSLVSPKAFSHSTRTRRIVKLLSNELRVVNSWQLEIAAMLSQLGCVTIPDAILQKIYEGTALEAEELKMYQGYPKAGSDLVANIPRLERITSIIEHQERLYAKSENGGPKGDDLLLESRILKVALDYDLLLMQGFESGIAFVEMKKRDGWYDQKVMNALERIVALENKYEIKEVLVEELNTKMILAENIVDTKGILLVSKGQEVTTSMRIKINNYKMNKEVKATVKVIIIKD